MVTPYDIPRRSVLELLLKWQRGHGDAFFFRKVFLLHHFQGLNRRITTLHRRRCRISAARPSRNSASCS